MSIFHIYRHILFVWGDIHNSAQGLLLAQYLRITHDTSQENIWSVVVLQGEIPCLMYSLALMDRIFNIKKVSIDLHIYLKFNTNLKQNLSMCWGIRKMYLKVNLEKNSQMIIIFRQRIINIHFPEILLCIYVLFPCLF